MWPFKQTRTLKESGLFEGFVDSHSHILPGVDDGVEIMEEALQVLRLYERLGVQKVWLTPHVMEDVPNATAHLRKRFELLKSNYQGSLQLRLASENMLDNLFDERLEQNDLLPWGEKGDQLLVETSYFTPPMDMFGLLKRIKAKGYHPILAHPERYVYMNKAYYDKLKRMDIQFQLNLLSFTGVYGSTACKKARQLLKSGQYNLVGTDLHRFRFFERRVNDSVDLQIIKKIPR